MVLLLARTHYSMLTAPASPRVLAEEALLRGHDHLVLVDGNGLYGLWPFAREAARLGLHGVFGCEITHGNHRLYVLAQDLRGYRSLCSLLSERHLDPDFDLPRAVARLIDGLLLLCADLELLPQIAARVPRERLFVALGPRGVPPQERLPSPTPKDRKAPDPGPRCERQDLVQAAAVLGLELCAVHDVWFPCPEDYASHLFFQAIKWNRSLRGGSGRELEAALPGELQDVISAAPAMHLPSRGSLHDGHRDCPAAVAVAERVLASCSLSFSSDREPVFPSYVLPDGVDPGEFLRGLAQSGLQERMPGADRTAVERLERELATVERMGFSPYFLVVREIVELARRRGIPCLGRGSAADSLLAYVLGLTNADPIRYGLLFERFLNPARQSLPDIDLDFCWRRRDELLDAVYEHFGRDRVAMIATYNTCGPRAAYAEAAKVAGLWTTEVSRRSRLLPGHGRRDEDLTDLVASTPGFYQRQVLPDGHEEAIVRTAQLLLRTPRHLGLHPGGVVITPGPVAQHAPLERAAKGVVVTQYDKRFVEALGLVKIDLLGNRALTIIEDCRKMLDRRGIEVTELDRLPEDDGMTRSLLRTGRTLGCFQVESPAMRTLLQQLEVADMDRVIQAIALVRPGPAAAGMKDAFIRRARGLESAEAGHPLLDELFADTFGIMLYQEDVIRAAMAVAGMSGADGDLLRRRLGDGDADGCELDAFIVAGLRRGVPRPLLEQVWQEMVRFAGYSFCKAHAVSYGRLAYYCVYLKSRWPAAFMAALLSNDAGYFEKGVYIEEAKRLGVRFLEPCVNEGQIRFDLVGDTTVRIGLSEVRGLTERTCEQIMVARQQGGPFRSLVDWLERVGPRRDEAERLIRIGALDGLGMPRRELLWRLSVAESARHRKSPAAGPGLLWAGALLPREVRYPQLLPFSEQERCREELFALGYTVGAHPVDVLWGRTRAEQAPRAVACGRASEFQGRTMQVCGWMVAWRQYRSPRGGLMAFATIEDGTGVVECTLFPRVLQECEFVLRGRGPYVVSGVKEARIGGQVGLRVTALRRLVGSEDGLRKQ
ncbi:MAG: DNA polymerase III subunit alpha [Planctomycetota bacterium]|nr:DNA polymerase III subunit alpha [Planctomycetota bacterium]